MLKVPFDAARVFPILAEAILSTYNSYSTGGVVGMPGWSQGTCMFCGRSWNVEVENRKDHLRFIDVHPEREEHSPGCLVLWARENESPRPTHTPIPDVYFALTVQALRMRKEVFSGVGMRLKDFDQMYLDGIGPYERQVAEEEGIDLSDLNTDDGRLL